MKDLKNENTLKQLWGDLASGESVNKIQVNFDTSSGQIVVSGQGHQWQNTAVPAPAVVEAPQAVKEEVDLPLTPASVASTPEAEAPKPTIVDPVEMQKEKEMAFKILYFFCGFTVLTYVLLYVFYRLDKQEQAKEIREKRQKNLFYGEVNQQAFFDFLATSVDEENFKVGGEKKQWEEGLNSTRSTQDGKL